MLDSTRVEAKPTDDNSEILLLTRTSEVLYGIAWQYLDQPIEDEPVHDDDYVRFDEPGEKLGDPAGWAAHCEELWGEYKPFFWPSDKRLYRTLDAAQGRSNLINHWGGRTVVVVAEVNWVPLDRMQEKWEKERLLLKEAALVRELNSIRAALQPSN